MCSPTLAVMGVGMAISMMGSMQQADAQKKAGQAQNDALQYQAAVDRNNAIIRQQDGDAAFETGQQKAAERGIKTAADRARFLAAGAGQGQAVGVDGSIDQVAGDISEIGRMDQLSLAYEGARDKRNFETQAQNLRSSSTLKLFEGENAELQGNAKAQGTLISAVGSATQTVASKWSAFKK